MTGWRRKVLALKGALSVWLPDRSGVPHGSVLGPLLGTPAIINLDGGIEGFVDKLANNTKIGGETVTVKNFLSVEMSSSHRLAQIRRVAMKLQI